MVWAHVDSASLTNPAIAQRLLAVAAELRRQGANPWRIEAYCTAAKIIRRLPRPLVEIAATEGVPGIRNLHIGKSLTEWLFEFLSNGQLLPPLHARQRQCPGSDSMRGSGPEALNI